MAACIEARKLDSDAVLVNLGARFQNVGYGLSCFNIILLTVFRGLADPHFGVGDHVLALVDLYTERLSDDRCLNDLDSAVADIDLKLLAINSEGAGYNYRLSNQIRADQDFLLGNGDARQANGGLGLLEFYADVEEEHSKEQYEEVVHSLLAYEDSAAQFRKQLRKPSAKRACICGSGRPFGKCHEEAWRGLKRMVTALRRLGLKPESL